MRGHLQTKVQQREPMHKSRPDPEDRSGKGWVRANLSEKEGNVASQGSRFSQGKRGHGVAEEAPDPAVPGS